MLDVLKDAFKTAVKNPITYAAIVCIPLIVAMFGLMYAGTFHTPYDKLDSIPAAIINLDKGATVNGEEKNYGQEIADAIEEGKALDWHMEDAATYEAGLENTQYFMALIIPEDFSAKISSGKDSAPQQADVIFWKNSRKNYMVSTMANVVEAKLKATVTQKISEQYATALAEGLEDAKDGMSQAAEGADKLGDGADKLKDGLSDAKSGADKLNSGISNLKSGLGDLKSGSGNIKDAIDAINAGSKQFNGSLSAGIDSNADSKVAAAQNALNSALTAHSQLVAAKSAGYALNAYAQTGQPPTDAAVAAFLSNDAEIQASAGNVAAAAQTLAEAAGNKGASQALSQALSGYSDINAGINALASKYSEFNAGVNSASAGANKLSQGGKSLSSGLSNAKDGAASVSDGAGELSQSLSDGADEIGESLTADADEYGEYVAQPIDVETEDFGALDKFGWGFIPLFMSICFWIGALMIYFVFEPFPSYQLIRKNRFASVLGRFPIYMAMMALEVVTVLGIGIGILGLQYTDLTTLVLLVCTIAFTYMCILYFLNLFDRIGKATAVVILILQIVCCYGTFPAFLGTDFAEAISQYLPFFYSVDGYREVISGGNLAQVYFDMGILLLYALGAIILSLVCYPLGLKLKLKQDKKRAIEYMEWADGNGKHAQAAAGDSASGV